MLRDKLSSAPRARFKRLSPGLWGAEVKDAPKLDVGDTIVIERRDGQLVLGVVSRILESKPGRHVVLLDGMREKKKAKPYEVCSKCKARYPYTCQIDPNETLCPVCDPGEVPF